MDRLDALVAHVETVGKRMVACKRQCQGIARHPEEGILPRGLVLDVDGRREDRGCVIVGINPGHASHRAREYHIANDLSYDSVVADWRNHNADWAYYPKLRQLADALGLTGPILWTEIVKCESAVANDLPPLQTIRVCTNACLAEELRLAPSEWPLLAVGRLTYRTLAYGQPGRPVIGVPHPTGSRGQFARLFADGQLRREFREVADSLWDGDTGRAVWLPEEETMQPERGTVGREAN